MLTQVTGQFGPVVVARLDPHADLLECLYEIARTNNMTAGVILSITGSLEYAVLQKFKRDADNDEINSVLEVEGPMVVSGHGVIGLVDAPERGDVPFGAGGYVHGEPYADVHLAVNSPEHKLVGHVLKGCRVRSHQPISHFTIIVAPVEGVALKHTIDGTPESGHLGVYHLLEVTS